MLNEHAVIQKTLEPAVCYTNVNPYTEEEIYNFKMKEFLIVSEFIVWIRPLREFKEKFEPVKLKE